MQDQAVGPDLDPEVADPPAEPGAHQRVERRRRAVFEQCNPAYCALLGYAEEEFRRVPFASLVHPDDREANLAEIRRPRAGEVPSFEIDNRYVHKSGRPVWVRKWVSFLPDEAGRPAHLMARVTDTTGRRRAEQALRDCEARFRTLAGSTANPRASSPASAAWRCCSRSRVSRCASRAGTVVVVADRSRSMPAGSDAAHKELIDLLDAGMGSHDRLAVASFGQTVAVEHAPDAGKFPAFTHEVGPDGSGLTEAVGGAPP